MDPRMAEFVDHLKEEQLRDLNRLIVDRLRLLHERRAREAAGAFSIGDAVEFQSDCGHKVTGRVARINRKSITVAGSQGSWRVHPKLLRRAQPSPPAPPAQGGQSILSNLLFSP